MSDTPITDAAASFRCDGDCVDADVARTLERERGVAVAALARRVTGGHLGNCPFTRETKPGDEGYNDCDCGAALLESLGMPVFNGRDSQ